MKYSERFVYSKMFRGLKIDKDCLIRNDTRGSISFKELKSVLLSKDMNLYEEFKKKYLDDK